MEILKEGSVPSKKEFFRDAKVTCMKRDEYDRGGCGVVLRFGPDDLVPRYYEASHSNKYYFVVICPRCAHDCFIKLSTVVWQEIMTEEMKKKATFDGFSDRG